MEKAIIIFSILTHDYGFMMCFWGIVALPVCTWHLWYFRSDKNYSEKELIELNPKFSGINSQYLVFTVFWVFIAIAFFIAEIQPRLDKWALLNYGIRFYPVIQIFFGGLGIHQGLFALITGVYPMGKTTSYIYDIKARIYRIAIYQILITIATITASTLFFLATAH